MLSKNLHEINFGVVVDDGVGTILLDYRFTNYADVTAKEDSVF